MKALSFLSPVLNLIKHFGFIYRILGVIGCFVFFSSNFQDLMFTSTSNNTEAMSIEDLIALPQNQIPRYLKLKDLTLANDNYVATQDEDSGRIIDASYPVYSLKQISDLDTLNPNSLVAHVIIKDKDFDENSLQLIMDVDGMYDNESFLEEKRILTENGVNVSEKAVLIVKSKPPSFQSSLIWTLVTGLLGLLILLSFVPNSMMGIEEEPEEENPTE